MNETEHSDTSETDELSEKPPSTPEMWLMAMVGMAGGFVCVGVVTAVSERFIQPTVAFGIGIGLVGVAILWYLWVTRDNYMPALRGESDV